MKWSDPLVISTLLIAIATLSVSFILAVYKKWTIRAENLRNSEARKENDLHRDRFREMYNHLDGNGGSGTDMYCKWIRGFDQMDKSQPPGLHAPGFDEAYKDYLRHLEAKYTPSRINYNSL